MNNALSKKIRSARQAAGLTQDALAKELGVTRGAVTQWESINALSRTTPTFETIKHIVEVMGVPLNWLVDDKYPADDASNVRKLHAQGRWSEMPAAFDGVVPPPPGMPNFTRATVIEDVGLVLHAENDTSDGRHPRMAELFWGAVEYQLLQEHPEQADFFKAKIPDAAQADYFNGHAIVELASWNSGNLMFLQWRRRIGNLLFAEKMLGKPVRKIVLLWSADTVAPLAYASTAEMFQRAGVELHCFTKPDQATNFLLELI